MHLSIVGNRAGVGSVHGIGCLMQLLALRRGPVLFCHSWVAASQVIIIIVLVVQRSKLRRCAGCHGGA
jgi:hypothetical protein